MSARRLGPVVGLAALAVLSVTVLEARAAAPEPSRAAAAPARDSCTACHLETGDDRLAGPARAYAGDVHFARGFGCAACHGGDPKDEGMGAMDPRKGYVGKPDHRQVVRVCGRCHSDARFMRQYNPSLRVDQVAEYATSMHGRRLRERNDPRVATCSSCHPAHAIKPPSDPMSSVHPLRVADTCGRCHGDAAYMAGYKIPTDQRDRYRRSVHWRAMTVKGDLSAPTCNDCHGNHGAVPPGLAGVGNVCGQCHSVQGEIFAKSAHASAFVAMGVPGCVACHGNHAILEAEDAMLGLGAGAACGSCHAPGDAGGRAAVAMRGLVDSLATEHERARALLRRAEHAGIEVSQAQFELNGAKDALVTARAVIHASATDLVKKEVDGGLAIAARAHARGVRALEELRFRRTGLAVSVVIIVALIVALVLKIREIDRRQAADARRG